MRFSKGLLLIIILSIILTVSFLLTPKIYLSVFKDVVNIYLILSLFFFLFLFIKSKENIHFFVDNLITLIIYSGFGISILGLSLKLVIITIKDFDDIDYNFALLPVFFSILGIIFKLLKTDSLSRKIRFLYYVFLVTNIIQVLFSGSRRGMILYLIIIFALFFLRSYLWYKKKAFSGTQLYSSRARILFPVWFFILIPVGLYLFLLYSSFRIKESVFDLIGSKDHESAKYNLAYSLNRYTSSVNKKLDFTAIYQSIWPAEYNPIDLISALDSIKYTTSDEFTGLNLEIVPNGATGYVLDSKSFANFGQKKIYRINLTDNLRVRDGDSLEASIYCYVSKDFDGKSVELLAEGLFTGNAKSQYLVFDAKKLNRDKNFNLISNGNFENGTSFWLPKADSTKHFLIDTPFGKGVRVKRTNGNEGDWPLLYSGRRMFLYANHTYKLHFFFKVVQGISLPFNIGWWLDDAGQGIMRTAVLPIDIIEREDGWMEATCSYKFRETHISDYFFMNSLRSNSVVDFAKIELFDLDMDNSVPVFIDEDKDTWQKLSFAAICNKGITKISFNLLPSENNNHDSFTGYVIFAEPHYKITHYNDKHNDISSIDSDLKNPVPDRMYKSELSIPGFSNLILNVTNPDADSLEHDLIRRVVSKFISEDTTYLGYKNFLSVDTLTNNLFGPRIMIWQFAIQIFLKEYDWRKKIFGGGFTFFNWFGYYFANDKTISGNPHNPFLSVLLYSGLLGLILYIYVFYKTVRYYYMFFREFYMLGLYFLITLFFSFFSGQSAFDPPMMGFFIILPQFLNTVYNINANNLNVKNRNA